MPLRTWTTKKLRPGDLTALSEIRRRYWAEPEADRVDRLNRRGFVKMKAEKPVITLLGRSALLIRRLTRH
jgi:hypothetical protein